MTTWLQVVEVGLKYSKTIASMFVFIISLGGYSFYDFVETEKDLAIREVVVGFQSVIETDHVLIEEVEVKIKPVVTEFSCDSCRNWWLKDLKEVEERLEKKYHK